MKSSASKCHQVVNVQWHPFHDGQGPLADLMLFEEDFHKLFLGFLYFLQ